MQSPHSMNPCHASNFPPSPSVTLLLILALPSARCERRHNIPSSRPRRRRGCPGPWLEVGNLDGQPRLVGPCQQTEPHVPRGHTVAAGDCDGHGKELKQPPPHRPPVAAPAPRHRGSDISQRAGDSAQRLNNVGRQRSFALVDGLFEFGDVREQRLEVNDGFGGGPVVAHETRQRPACRSNKASR